MLRCDVLQCVRGLAQAAQAEVKLPPQHGVPGRYASALYMAAVKANKLPAIEKELNEVASMIKESSDLRLIVSDPSVPRSVKIAGLNNVLTKMNASDITKNFMGKGTMSSISLYLVSGTHWCSGAQTEHLAHPSSAEASCD